MDIKDLRIGNYIIGNYTDYNTNEAKQELCKVVCIDSVGITENTIWVESKGSDIEKYNSFEHLKPTPRILQKFGFNKEEMGSVSHQFNYGENHITKGWEIQLVWLMYLDNELNTCFEEYPFYQNGYQELKSISQIQNLYKDLTNKDLELIGEFSL